METNLTSNCEDTVSIPGLLSGLRIWHCRELCCRSQTRLGTGVAVLWCRPVATAPIRPLAQEPPYASGAALIRQKRRKTCNIIFGVILSSENVLVNALLLCVTRYPEPYSIGDGGSYFPQPQSTCKLKGSPSPTANQWSDKDRAQNSELEVQNSFIPLILHNFQKCSVSPQ